MSRFLIKTSGKGLLPAGVCVGHIEDIEGADDAYQALKEKWGVKNPQHFDVSKEP